MACFHPNHIHTYVNPSGEVVTKFDGGAGLLTASDLYYKNPGDFHVLVPCGRCMGCRMDRSRAWADRMLLELADNDYKAIFVTLTYDEAHVPLVRPRDSGYYFLPGDDESTYLSNDETWLLDACDVPKTRTLRVRDTQLFFKRLRKAFSGVRIRYFLAGEYGPKTQRPHYHAIIYGLTVSDFPDSIVLKYNDLGQPLFQSDFFSSIWRNGFCSLAVVNWHTCSYVARYTMKKLYKSDDASAYSDGRVPPFCCMSRRPGIGLLRAADLLAKGDKAFVKDADGVHEVYLSRSFIRSASREHERNLFDTPKISLPALDSYRKLSQSRVVNSVERTISNLTLFGGIVMEFYRIKEVYFLQRLKLLPERGDLVGKAFSCKSPEG